MSDQQYRALLAGLRYDPRVLSYDGEHPFQHCMDVVVPAMAEQGKTPDDPQAFCGWWKAEHGEPRNAMRHLHLRACAGKPKIVNEDGTDYIVVPVVALMEGVIHAVNAKSPEFVPLTTLQDAATSWNGKPVTIGHPVREGRQCSADNPEILEAHGIGVIRNSRVEDRRLLQEAWIRKDRVRKLDPALHDRLLEGRTDEVSVGSFVATTDEESEFKGKKYRKRWNAAKGDHLAFIIGGRGACSVEMGCGTFRAASHSINDEDIVIESDLDLDSVMAFVAAAGARHSSADVTMIQTIHDHAMNLGAKCERSNYKTLGSGEPELRTACGCHQGESTMNWTKEKRAEVIASLITDKYSGFKDGDEKFLEGATDDRLQEFRTAADANKKTAEEYARLQNDQQNTSARLKVTEEKLKTLEDRQMTEQEFLDSPAGATLRTLVAEHKAKEESEKTDLLKTLAAVGAHSEEDLKKMDIAQLRTLAKYVKPATDFRARGIPPVEPRVAAEGKKPGQYAPPNAYEADIKKRQATIQ